jgi:hypothetical protein
MSEFAYFRFQSAKLLNSDEENHKDEIIELTEEVLGSKGIECDTGCAKLSDKEIADIFKEVRRLYREKKKKKKNIVSAADDSSVSIEGLEEDDQSEQHDKQELVHAT